jgi:hypothetical protein
MSQQAWHLRWGHLVVIIPSWPRTCWGRRGSVIYFFTRADCFHPWLVECCVCAIVDMPHFYCTHTHTRICTCPGQRLPQPTDITCLLRFLVQEMDASIFFPCKPHTWGQLSLAFRSLHAHNANDNYSVLKYSKHLCCQDVVHSVLEYTYTWISHGRQGI